MPTKSFGSVLLDTNIILRLATPLHPDREPVRVALRNLASSGAAVYLCPQNIQEFRQVATRPVAANGLGWTSADTALHIDALEGDFSFLSETNQIYKAWRRITEAAMCLGRANFDARLIAIAEVHRVEAVMTFETAAFARYAAVAPVIILEPRAVSVAPASQSIDKPDNESASGRGADDAGS